LLFSEEYKIIREELDREYHIPDSTEFKKREFFEIRWKDSRNKNFLYIMKVLSEHGSVTIGEMTDFDGLSDRKRLKKKRWDTYNRLINGDDAIEGLRKKRLVMEDGVVLKSKYTKKYKLSIFGVFYALHLFSDSRHKSIMTILAKNYQSLLPYIFGKWDFLQKELGREIEILTDLAHRGSSDFVTSLQPLANSRAVSVKDWRSRQGVYADEITMWFFGKLSTIFPARKFRGIINTDKEIAIWYSKIIKNLLQINKEEYYHIKYVNYAIKEKFEHANQMLKQHNALQGI